MSPRLGSARWTLCALALIRALALFEALGSGEEADRVRTLLRGR